MVHAAVEPTPTNCHRPRFAVTLIKRKSESMPMPLWKKIAKAALSRDVCLKFGIISGR